VVVEPASASGYRESLSAPRPVFDVRQRLPEQAQYCVAAGLRIRYVMQMNAREAMHLIELRRGPQSSELPSHRQEMARSSRQAGHHGIPTP